ncbi:MAG TPA: glucose 1-dehydrogenase [Longimicrobiaceae bacterium]|nr:glucose 1-dehydrogenase [Longimicrobiaceae bacterium]
MSAYDLRSEGAVALITGGASGLGRATAEVFGEAGYRVLIADCDAERGEATAADLTSAGIICAAVAADVADPAQARAAVEAAVERWDRLDFVFNNAGILGAPRRVEEMDEEVLGRVLDVNLKGAFHICKHAVGQMLHGGGGSILNVASITAWRGAAFYAPYAAAKAGIAALTRSSARRLGRHNIRVNCLSPGSIAGTGLSGSVDPARRRQDSAQLMRDIPVGRPASPRDVAHVALFLASPLACHIHGAVLTVDGGESLGYQ